MLDFLAEFTQHIPAKDSHLIRYYGWYSNKARGMRKKANAPDAPAAVEDDSEFKKACRQRWGMLIRRIYEVDPLACPQCSAQMKVVSFIDPPQEKSGDSIQVFVPSINLHRKTSMASPDYSNTEH